MIKLNDYLVNFHMLEGVDATQFLQEEFVDILEDRILIQWKMEFKKEGFDLNSVTLKEFLNVCMCLEEAMLHKPFAKKIAHVQKEHDEAKEDRKARCHAKSELHHRRHHGHGKCHAGKQKKKHCNYHGLCHHDTEECNIYKAYRKHAQPTHHITEEQRLRQVCFVKDAKSYTKKHSLSTKEVKDLNAFVKYKIDKTIREHARNEQLQGSTNLL
eukprot:4489039-Ditylum_brightwellii.AAC.1